MESKILYQTLRESCFMPGDTLQVSHSTAAVSWEVQRPDHCVGWKSFKVKGFYHFKKAVVVVWKLSGRGPVDKTLTVKLASKVLDSRIICDWSGFKKKLKVDELAIYKAFNMFGCEKAYLYVWGQHYAK